MLAPTDQSPSVVERFYIFQCHSLLICLDACKGSETNVHLGIKAALLSSLKASIFQNYFKVSEGSEVLY